MNIQEFAEEFAKITSLMELKEKIVANEKEDLLTLYKQKRQLVEDNEDVLEAGVFDVPDGHVTIVEGDYGIYSIFHRS